MALSPCKCLFVSDDLLKTLLSFLFLLLLFEPLMHARLYAKYLIDIISLNPQNNPKTRPRYTAQDTYE